MGTLQIVSSGFANLPSTPPSDWPANLTWPASGGTNGTKSYTISDADWIKIMSWSANANNAQLVAGSTNPPPAPPPYSVTGAGVLLSLVQNWINGIIQAVQVHGTVPAQQPPPITIQ